MQRHIWGFILFALAGLHTRPTIAQDVSTHDLDLRGVIGGGQVDSFVAVPFHVPAGVKRLEVDFAYTGKEDHATLDLGLWDPERFRGWSGGNKHAFSVSATNATPSYLPGPLPAGTWKLMIGVASLRKGHAAAYHAHIHMVRNADVDTLGFTAEPIEKKERWYRGDLHMHTAHSDGSCSSQSGQSVPCPLFVTVEAAVKQKLDFIAITDHNTVSHYDAERELQPYFDRLLLIPGRELTTYSGHANLFGPTEFLDFRSEAKGTPSINRVFREARAAGGIVSINHPGAPTGESCIGCGWSVTDTDWDLVTGIEAINGANPANYESGIRFWEQQLTKGHRLIAVGGSDTHRPERGTTGHPTTVVHARELSVNGVMHAIREGHVCIDVTASQDKMLDFEAANGISHATMGDRMAAASHDRIALTAHVAGSAGSTLHWLVDGKDAAGLQNASITSNAADLTATWSSDGKRHWLRAEVRGTGDALEVLGNPIFINWPGTP